MTESAHPDRPSDSVVSAATAEGYEEHARLCTCSAGVGGPGDMWTCDHCMDGCRYGK